MKATPLALLAAGQIIIPTDTEWTVMRQDDPVFEFTEKVNAAAVAKPYWRTDFRRAHYDAFTEEANRYALEKYRKTHKP